MTATTLTARGTAVAHIAPWPSRLEHNIYAPCGSRAAQRDCFAAANNARRRVAFSYNNHMRALFTARDYIFRCAGCALFLTSGMANAAILLPTGGGWRRAGGVYHAC